MVFAHLSRAWHWLYANACLYTSPHSGAHHPQRHPRTKSGCLSRLPVHQLPLCRWNTNLCVECDSHQTGWGWAEGCVATVGGGVKFACLCVWSCHLYIDISAASAQWHTLLLLAGKVNITVSSVAEDSHDLCDNQVAVTPLRGKTDTVIKSLLVKVSQTQSGEHLGTVSYPMRRLTRRSLDLSWKQAYWGMETSFPAFPFWITLSSPAARRCTAEEDAKCLSLCYRYGT